MEPDAEFYRPDDRTEPATAPTVAELRERERLTASIARHLAVINAVDREELEQLERRIKAIAADLKVIHDADVVKELSAEQ
jgi:hypothetical protein